VHAYGVCKGMMHPDDLIIVDRKGNHLQGRMKGTSEIAMHLASTICAPTCGLSCTSPARGYGLRTAGRALNLALLPEVIIVWAACLWPVTACRGLRS